MPHTTHVIVRKPGDLGWLLRTLAILVMVAALTAPAQAQDDEAAELAKQFANPVASLISVPVQYNHDEYGGTNEGAEASRLNVQPVIPFSMNEDWNLITRTIVPVFVDQQGFPQTAMNESGLGDITASQFFSPKSPSAGGWIWGVGPVELLPTAADRCLARKVGYRANGSGAEANRAVDGRLSG